MLPVLRQIAKPSTGQYLRVARCYASGHGMTLKEVYEDRGATMDNLPVPQGDWQTKYGEKNRRRNMHILLSSFFLALGYYASYSSGSHRSTDWTLPKDYNIHKVIEELEAQDAAAAAAAAGDDE